MCLQTLEPIRRKRGFAYKVVKPASRRAKKTFVPPVWTHSRAKFRMGKWITDPCEEHVYGGHRAGFHCMTSKEGCKRWGILGDEVVLRVEYEDVTAYGVQKVHRGKQYKAVVARRIRPIEVVEVR